MGMVVKRVEQRRAFTALDQSGNMRIVYMSVPILDVSNMEDPNGEADGGECQLRTREGQTVNALGDNRYQIVQTGEILIKQP